MPYCSRCGVEVDETVPQCPLCEAPIQQIPMKSAGPWPREEAPYPPAAPMSPEEKRALGRSMTTFGFLIPLLIVLAVDWFFTRNLSWSLIVGTALGAAWLWSIIPLYLGRRPYALIVVCSVVAMGLLGAISGLTGRREIFFPLGLVLAAAVTMATAAVTAATRTSKKRGGNVAAFILVAAGWVSVVTDLSVHLNFSGQWKIGWSLIVLATTLPVAALVLYLHYRPNRRSRIRRYFHI